MINNEKYSEAKESMERFAESMGTLQTNVHPLVDTADSFPFHKDVLYTDSSVQEKSPMIWIGIWGQK